MLQRVAWMFTFINAPAVVEAIDRAADALFFNPKAIAARIENYAAQCMPPQEAAVVRLEVGELLARLRKNSSALRTRLDASEEAGGDIDALVVCRKF